MDLRVGKHYQLLKKIGSGAFGEIYEGRHIQTKDIVAIKLEPMKAQFPQLEYENKLYRMLQGGTGIAETYWYGMEGDYKCMVMEMLGKSLEDLFQFCGRKLSLKTVCMLADQMITRVEYMHTQNFLHRDMKPDNFLIGIKNKQSQVYLIDFGLSKRYKDAKTGEHIPYRDGKSLTGTARYASVNTHIGVEQSRRDDLESIGYILLYFLKGVLPWQGLPGGRNKNEKYDKIKDKKLHTTVESLCMQTPEEFSRYITMCRHFRFDEKPDYTSLRHLFQNIMKRFNYDYDGQYDWVLKMNGGKPDPTAVNAMKDKPPMPNAPQNGQRAQLPPSGGMVTRKSQHFREERKESRAQLGAQLMNQQQSQERRNTPNRQPQMQHQPMSQPQTNRVIPRYNEFNNEPQYGQKAIQATQNNQQYQSLNQLKNVTRGGSATRPNRLQTDQSAHRNNSNVQSSQPRVATYNSKLARF